MRGRRDTLGVTKRELINVSLLRIMFKCTYQKRYNVSTRLWTTCDEVLSEKSNLVEDGGAIRWCWYLNIDSASRVKSITDEKIPASEGDPVNSFSSHCLLSYESESSYSMSDEYSTHPEADGTILDVADEVDPLNRLDTVLLQEELSWWCRVSDSSWDSSNRWICKIFFFNRWRYSRLNLLMSSRL